MFENIVKQHFEFRWSVYTLSSFYQETYTIIICNYQNPLGYKSCRFLLNKIRQVIIKDLHADSFNHDRCAAFVPSLIVWHIRIALEHYSINLRLGIPHRSVLLFCHFSF